MICMCHANLATAQQRDASLEPQGIASARVSGFAEGGMTGDVVRRLVRSLSARGLFVGVFGLENVEGRSRRIWLAANDQDVAALVDNICAQDPSLKVVRPKDLNILNLVSVDAAAPGHDILEFAIPSLDVEADLYPEEAIWKIAEFSHELNEYLLGVFKRGGGLESDGHAISGVAGNAKRPHFSIHIKNTTVREALNAISVESLRMYRTNGRDPRMVSAPDEVLICPTGWEFHFIRPAGMLYDAWLREMFRPLM
jgi:hypothetical protein